MVYYDEIQPEGGIMQNLTPDPEFIKLAEEFSKRYKSMESPIPGNPLHFQSDPTGKYRIDLHYDLFTNSGNIDKGPLRVNNSYKTIEVNKSRIDDLKLSENFLFFILLWAYYKAFHFEASISDFHADQAAMDHYTTTGRKIKDAVIDFITILEHSATPHNTKRVELIMATAKKYHDQQNKNDEKI